MEGTRLQLRLAAEGFHQDIFDEVLLGHREGHDTYAALCELGIGEATDDLLHNCLGLGLVAAFSAFVINAVELYERHLLQTVVG